MCLILFAYRIHPRYELLLAANRDEFYARPTAAMDYWQEAPELLAGRDLQSGGTWFGITRQRRLAAITNFREPDSVKPDAPSRGLLVCDYLLGQEPARDYLDHLLSRADDYNGFNLLLWDSEGLYYFSNRDTTPRALAPGYYGLSNHLLNTPWPKVQRGLKGLAELLEQNAEIEPKRLLNLLQDQIPADDRELPQTGVSLEWERALSPLFIATPDYGTRSSTVLRVTKEQELWLTETTWPEGATREFRLRWLSATVSDE